MKIFNPATAELLKEVNADNRASLNQKFEELRLGQKQWAKKELSARISILKNFRQLLLDNADSLALTLTQEMGKPIQEAHNEIKGAAFRIQFFLEESEKVLTTKKIHQDGNTHEYLSFEAHGVIANISAWNYPYLVGVNVYVPALIAGNAVLYKPSEHATLTGIKVSELLYQAGVPQDVFALAIGEREVGEILLDLPCRAYFFTGSYKTGKSIAEKIAPRLVPVGLELGGNDPLYVTDQVKSIEATATAAAEGVFYNNGQSCCAVKRIYVHEKVYDQFLTHFLSESKKLKVGNPQDRTFQQGAIARPQHLSFLQELVDDAVQKGAKLELGGKKWEGKGAFYPPTVLTSVNHHMRLMKEEAFGPVIGVQKVKNDEEAVALMDDTLYGLTAAIYTSNEARGKKIIDSLDVGTGYLNCCDRVTPYLPWAGRRHSGLGATLSYLGILAFVKPKAQHLRQLD